MAKKQLIKMSTSDKECKKKGLNRAYEKLENVIWWVKREKNIVKYKIQKIKKKWVMNFILICCKQS